MASPLRALKGQRPGLLPAFGAFVRDNSPVAGTSALVIDALAADRPVDSLKSALLIWETTWEGGSDPDATLEALLEQQSADGHRLLQQLAVFTDNVDEFATVASMLQSLELQVALSAHRAHARVVASMPVRAGRLDALGVVSHELRTPLTGIMGYAELLEDALAVELTGRLDNEPLEAYGQYVAKIQEAAQRLMRLVEDLLDVAKLDSGTFSVVRQEADLAGLLEEAVALMTPQARTRGVTLVCELEPGDWHTTLDPKRIWQVVANLVQNALKFTPDGGRVTVRGSLSADRRRIEVVDTGAGFPPALAAHLFEKFYQVDQRLSREHSGAGLGLSICKALVEAHGGTIGAASAPGIGSTFWFELPR